MDFELSDEQRLLRDTMRSFVDEQIRPVAREWEESGRYPEEIVATMRDMGLFGLLVPEEYGGMAADMVSLAVVFEEISRGWMGVAGIIGSHSLSCWMIARYGTQEQKREHLPALASGERRTGPRTRACPCSSWIPPRPVLRWSGTCRSSGTGDPRPANSCSTRCWCRRRACSAARRAGACSRCSLRWRKAGSTSPPGRWELPRRPTPRPCATPASGRPLARRFPDSRPSSSSWPTWP